MESDACHHVVETRTLADLDGRQSLLGRAEKIHGWEIQTMSLTVRFQNDQCSPQSLESPLPAARTALQAAQTLAGNLATGPLIPHPGILAGGGVHRCQTHLFHVQVLLGAGLKKL